MNMLGTGMTSLDATALKLHTAPDETVWFADGTHAPIGSGLTIHQFVSSLHDRRQPFIRVLGTSFNAMLITQLWPLCRNDGRLQVASPAICESRAEQANPEITLYRMRQVCLSPSLGGWHDFSPQDYSSYSLVAQIQRDSGVGQHAVEIVRNHPAWPYISFVHGLSEAWAAWVLYFVVDPRWHIDPEFPDRVGRLQWSLGLRPETQQRVTGAVDVDGWAADVDVPAMGRCKSVMRAWKGDTPNVEDWEHPGNFLWRIWRAAGGGARGDLKASQKFIVFLRHSWMDALYRDTTSRGADPLFIPDMLFQCAAEVEAFEAHIAERRRAI